MNLKIEQIKNRCTGCMACYNECPVDAILMEENKEGFHYPAVNYDECIDCKLCDAVCPELCINELKKTENVKKAFYGWHKNDDIRLQSSSGGLFTAFAEFILENQGVIYGAVYDFSLKMVIHKSTDKVSLDVLRKSKYVQSYIGNVFQSVKKKLKEDRYVMFVGTPCQAAGLKLYLKKKYDKLLLCDFICHGVPPMKLLNEYIIMLEKKYRSEHVGYDFRPKTSGWTAQVFKCNFKNGKVFTSSARFVGYLNCFYQNFSLRKSCYECSYCNNQHDSDITLADYWGYKKYKPEIYDDKGLSLLLVNTDKGISFLSEIPIESVTINPLAWKYAEYVFKKRDTECYNIKKRNAFFNYYLSHGYKSVIRKFKLEGRFVAKVKYGIKKLLRSN